MEHSEFREEIPHGDHPISYDHAEPRYRTIAAIIGITVVLLIVIGIAIQAYYELIYNNEEYSRVISQENWTLRDLRNQEQWELSHYGYVDKSKGTVRIPIDQAMQLVVRDAAENRLPYPSNSYPVKTPEQLAAASGTPAVSQTGVGAAGGAPTTAPGNTPTQSTPAPTSNPNVQPPAPKH